MAEKDMMSFGDDISISDSEITTMVMMVMMIVVMMKLLAPVTTSMAQFTQAQSFQGRTDPRTLYASPRLKWIDLLHEHPRTPWITAYFINDGPYAVEIAINNPADRFTINPCGSITINRAGAQERISIIYYITQQISETATVRVTGEY